MTAQRKILIVEDDKELKRNLQVFLEGYGYSTMAVPNAKLAMNLLAVEKFDAVISDLRLPAGSGVQLLRHVKKTSKIPVILMTGFDDMDTQEATELGAYYFLQKPFQSEELLQVLTYCFDSDSPISRANASSSSSAMRSEDLQFCRLNLDDFISGNQLQYDIYVRLSDKKYVKIAHKGDTLSQERIESYKAKNIKYLFMKLEDFRQYVGFNVNLTKMIKTSTTLPKQKKLQFMANANEIILSQFYLEGVNEESFESARTIMESTLSIMTDTDDLMTMVRMLSEHSNYLFAHSLGVALHASMIAKAVNWKSPNVLFKVTMAGLLHDIGKREIPQEIIVKPKALLTIPEIKILETHTIRGADILSKVPVIPTDIVQVAAQHHENCLGLGYPSGLKGKLIHPMARLVSVANEFCHLVVKGYDTQEPLKPRDALQNMIRGVLEGLDPTFFIALASVYQFTLPEGLEQDLAKRRKIDLI